ncbi:Bug family tripartite tricarboxylate transporter substrate binding protein [Falsiroseomonas sp. CW058]|uniref:Bug family tripartite tricarboxylate transporter substrate binding protein n=1 Tax=Falsiroseomonas sp. CW058 TaxID=3388664 RepID=UPI003D31A1C1
MIGRRGLMAGSGALLAAPALAQPLGGGRPVRLVVPFPPGGAVDILGRLIAERMQSVLGQTVVVENRSGAGGIIGADAVAKGDRDGTMLGLLGVTVFVAFPYMTSRLPFDPARDFSPVSQVTDGALLCVVNAETARRRGWRDFRDLVAWSRAHPEEVKMGSSGAGTSSHINIEAINNAAQAKILHVPYRGGGPAINDLVAGNIDMMFDVMPALMPHVEAGRFLAFAVSSRARLSILPEVPGMGDFADLGLGDHNLVTWNAIVAPGGTPEAITARLHAALVQVARQQDFVDRLKPLGYGTVTSPTPAALSALIEEERPRWRRLVEVSGARLD